MIETSTTVTRRSRVESSTSKRVTVNIGGLVYETCDVTLNKYPSTLLGSEATRQPYFCPRSNEYFFNRHREAFANILFFYQSRGKLYCPQGVKLKVFLAECEFFGLPEVAINLMKQKEGGVLEEDIYRFLNCKRTKATTLHSKVWEFIEHPSSSKNARIFSCFSLSVLALSITINCLRTVKELNNHVHDIWEIVDIVINMYFLIEFVVRMLISPSKVAFFKSVLVWIDFIALVTFVPLVGRHYADEQIALVLAPFQLFRVVRIFRVTKLLPLYNILEIIIKSSLVDVHIFACYFMFEAAVGGTIVFYLESQEEGTCFTSVPMSIYWAIQTLATLGYGDIVPMTWAGKLFASFFIVFFIPALSIPVLSMFVKFSKFCEFYNVITD